MPAQQINLLPKKDLDDSAVGKLLKFALTYGRYIIVGIQLIVLLAFFSRFNLDRELTDLQDSIDQKKAIVQSLSDFELEVRLIQDRLVAIKNLKQNHGLIRESMDNVKSVIPPGNALSRLNLIEGTIIITGVSQDENSLGNLLTSVNSSGRFSSVKIDRINKRSDSEMIDFSITLSLGEIPSTNDQIPNKFQ